MAVPLGRFKCVERNLEIAAGLRGRFDFPDRMNFPEYGRVLGAVLIAKELK